MIAVKKHVLLCYEEVLKNKVTFDEAYQIHCPADLTDVRITEHRSLIYEITLGALRTKERIEFYFDSLQLKKKPKGNLWSILTLTAYQLLFQDRANKKKLIYEAVELTKIFCSKQEVAFLHYIFSNKLEALEKIHAQKNLVLKGTQRKKYLSLGDFVYSHLHQATSPKWVSAFAEETLQRPQFYCRYLNNETSEKLKERHLKDGKIKTTPVRGVFSVQDFEILNNNKNLFVQDIGFQKVLLDLICQFEGKAQTVLDLCAAPGGKSFFLSNEGFNVTATDVNEKRLKSLSEFNEKLQLPIEVLTYESVLKLVSRQFDCVVVDAPCTSSGTLRKNPEVKWIKSEQDLNSLLEVQTALLDQALLHVKPGGFLFYSVCSVFKEEGENQITKFLEKNPNLSLIQKWIYEPGALKKEGESFLEDGHFAALLKCVK